MLNCYLQKYLTGIIVLVLLVINTSFAATQQDTTVKAPVHPGWASGIVLDEYSQPLKGVKITIKGSTDFTTSGDKGQFEINAAPGAILVFNYTDHFVREVTIKNNGKLTVKLDETYLKNPQTIDVLYGRESKVSELGAISTVYTNQLTTTPASLFTYAFPGQLSGVYTQQVSGFTSFNTAATSSASIIGQNLVNNGSNNNTTSDNSEMT